MKESTKQTALMATFHSVRFLRIFAFIMVILYAIALSSSMASGASNTYFEENLSVMAVSINNLTGKCGEYVDWDGDGARDLVGFKNATETDIMWQIFLNAGTSINPSFPNHAIFNFTKTGYMINKERGGQCVATVDIDADGDLDLLSYEYNIPDSTNISENIVNKTGYRGFWETSGTATAPVLTLNNALFEYSYIGNSAVQNPIGTVDEYHYPVGTLLGSPWLYDGLATGCALTYLTTACYGARVWTPDQHIYYQFFDADFDGDYDLFMSGGGSSVFWYENFGEPDDPYWIAGYFLTPNRYTTEYDNFEVVDFDSDGDPDYIGGAGAGIISTLFLGMANSRGWTDEATKVALNSVDRNSTIPWAEPTEEPTHGAYDYWALSVGDFDDDGDYDILSYARDSVGDEYNIYRNTGLIGDASGYSSTTPSCEFPCAVSETFEEYANNTDLNDLAGWTANDCVDIVDGDVVLKGSCTTARVCYELPDPITSSATVAFNITLNNTDSCRTSAHQDSYLGTHYINEWVANYLYHYRGTGLSREHLMNYSILTKYEYSNYMDFSDDNYTLNFGSNETWRDFFIYYGTHRELESVCFQAPYPDSQCIIHDLKIYAGTNAQSDTTGTYQAPTSRECYGAFCWSADSQFEDATPDSYVPQALDVGGIIVDWERCLEEGYRANLLCIPKLQWLDFKVSLGAWFTSNIVYIFIMLLFLLTIAVFVVRGRRSPE